MVKNINIYKIILIILILFCLTLVIAVIILEKGNNELMLSANNSIQSNALTMMLETDIDSNQYEAATSNDWPESGYIFNASMSGCERGGTLSWNNETNKVVMESLDPDKCYVYFDRYNSAVINNVTTSNITNSSITLTVDVTEGESSITAYYFSSDNGNSYVSSSTNTYTFNNLSTGTEYNFRVYVVDSNVIRSNTYSLNESTLTIMYLADYIKNNVYTGTDGDNGLYYHDGVGTYTNAAQEAGDNSYRYSGANPNNYVCFGSDTATCPNNNLYRIVGVFGDQVKLIKSTNWDYSYWSGSYHGDNIWSNSTLNTEKLNGTYLNGFETIWSEMIETTSWIVRGDIWENIAETTVKNAYTNEIVRPSSSETYSAKIGLMYVSDYGYAASPSAWTINLSSYNNSTNTSNNWLYLGSDEWTITCRWWAPGNVFLVASSGLVGSSTDRFSNDTNGFGVRPAFYLKPNVTITSGDGSSSNPYRLELN